MSLDEEETERTGRVTFRTPANNPVVVAARCTKVMLDERILEMAKTITGTSEGGVPFGHWEVPKFNWVNGVPGRGKTTWVVGRFDVERDITATTTTEQRGTSEKSHIESAHPSLTASEWFTGAGKGEVRPTNGRRGPYEPLALKTKTP